MRMVGPDILIAATTCGSFSSLTNQPGMVDT
jgi:hypothetical protein